MTDTISSLEFVGDPVAILKPPDMLCQQCISRLLLFALLFEPSSKEQRKIMNATEIGKRLVELTTSDRDEQAIEELYDKDIVSVEAANSSEGEAQKWEGVAAVKEKHAWWNSVTTLHGMKAEGPYAGIGDDHFVVKFSMDVTMDGQAREEITEVGLFEVSNGKIVREVYLPLNA